MTEPIRMSIPECQPPKYFDTTSLTSKLHVAPGAETSTTGRALDCARGVQTVVHPPLTLRPIIKPPSNRFRLEVLRKYPHLVNKDSLYDKKQEKLRDPEDPMISTYERDYGCTVGRFELYRSANSQVPTEQETVRLPEAAYKPSLWCPISLEMKKIYTLPGGGWALQRALKPKEPEKMNPAQGTGSIGIKWESEYRANIDGIAKYMKKIGALTGKQMAVHRIPTLPDD